MPPLPSSRPAAAPTLEIVCADIEVLVAAAFAVSLNDVRATTRRGPAAAFARQCAMYLAHVCLGLGHRRIGRLFRRDRTTARHGCALVEERRDNAQIDKRLHTLEAACIAMAERRGRP